MSTSDANDHFPLGKQNFILIGIGVLLVVIGFFLISGGGAPDDVSFSADVFNHMRMYVAPIVILLGYGAVMYGIIRK